MKRISVFILLFSTLTAFGQRKESFCESGKRTARERLANGQIYFPRYIFDSSITLRKMLEIDYGIIDHLYSEYCVSFEQERECHDSVMLNAICDKWGADFLDKQRQLANKLIKDGKGYTLPFSKDAGKGIDQLMRKGYADNGIQLKRFAIDLVISTTGQIIKYEIHSYSAGEVTQKEIDIIKDALSKYSDSWIPGRINDKLIEMDITIYIGKYVTMPE